MTLPILTAARVSPVRPGLSRMSSAFANLPAPPVTAVPLHADGTEQAEGILELADGSAYRGISFGAEGKSIAGECVFQTGMSNVRWSAPCPYV